MDERIEKAKDAKSAADYSAKMGERYYYAQINEVAEHCRRMSKGKGFEITPNDIDRYLLLIVSEVCEAQADLRDGHDIHHTWLDETGKPCGFPVEIADAIIRLLHLSAALNIDIANMINAKLHFNATRPPKHGKQF